MKGMMFRQLLFTSIVAALCVTMIGCPKDSGGNQSASSSGGSGGGKTKSPKGLYESKMPDGTAFQLDFHDGGAVKMTMIEGGTPDSHDGSWNVNGESILVQGASDGMTLQLKWKGDALVCDFGGIAMTFTKK